MLAKGLHIKVVLLGLLGLVSFNIYSERIMSHYVETDFETSPRGLKIYKNFTVNLAFSVDNLFIEKPTEGKTYEGLKINYNMANAIDQYDAKTFWTGTDNLAVLSHGNYLSIEKRSLTSPEEITLLYFRRQSLENYSFEILLSANATFNAFLVNQYTEQTTAIPSDGILYYYVSVDAKLPESEVHNRFETNSGSSTLNNYRLNDIVFSNHPKPENLKETLYSQAGNIHWLDNIKSVELLNLNGQIIEVFQTSEIDFSENIFQLNFKTKLNTRPYFLKIKTKQNLSSYKTIIK